MAWRCVRCIRSIRSIRCVRWSSKQVSTERNRCPPGEVGVHWAHFYWKIASGGHLKIPLGTKIRENRGRWRPFHMSTGRGIKSCPPDMIRAIFASGDTMNVLPAAVSLDECVRRAVCGIISCPPGMIRAIFASGDTMNILPAAVFLGEFVRWAICGIISCPPDMIRAIFASGRHSAPGGGQTTVLRSR